MNETNSTASDEERAKRLVVHRVYQDLRGALRALPTDKFEQAERLLIDLACAYGDLIATVRVASLRWAKNRPAPVVMSGTIQFDESDLGGEG